MVDGTITQAITFTAQAPTPAVVLNVGGGSITAVKSAGVVVIAQSGSSVTIAEGSATSFGDHEFSIGSAADAIVVDKTDVYVLPTATDNPVATFLAANGGTITAQSQDGNLVLSGAGTATTLSGQSGVFEGETVKLQASGSVLVVGSRTVTIPITTQVSMSDPTTEAEPEQVWTEGGATFVASHKGSSVVVVGRSSTITLADGAKTTFVGQTLSVASGTLDGALVIDGTSTLPLAGEQGAVTLTENGQTITASAVSSSIVLVENGGTITIANGAATTLPEGQIFSVPTSGGLIMADGTKTVSFAIAPSSTARTSSTSGSSIVVSTPTYPATGVSGGCKLRRGDVSVLFISLLAILI